MSFSLRSLYIFILVFIGGILCQDVSPPKVTVSPVEALTYQTVEETNPSSFKIQLILGGAITGKTCRIMKSSKTGDTFSYSEIGACPTNTSGNDDKCVRACSGEDIKLNFEKLSPRSKYIYVFAGTDTNTVTASPQPKGGKIFGFETPLLVNPQFSVTTDATSLKLKLATKTCVPVDCPIYYKEVKFAAGTKGNSCDTEGTADNSVDFDRLIPYYEVRCTGYPYFYYNMPNGYMKTNIEIYKPQFYLSKKSANDKQVALKFLNAPTHEICIFRIKDAVGESYESNCGNKKGECFAPCNQVTMVVSEPKSVYTITIQTRHHDLTIRDDKTYDGFTQNKYAMMDEGKELLSEFSKQGVTFDSGLLKVGGDGTTTTLTHYEADKLKPTASTTTTCAASSTTSNQDGGTCKSDGSKLVITGLKAGRAYIIEVVSSGITTPAGFKENIFVRAGKKDDLSYAADAVVTTGSDATVKAVSGTVGSDPQAEPSCEYYVSLAGKGQFYPVHCQHSNPCRGWCREKHQIIDLEPGARYDVKIVAHSDYSDYIYRDIQMKLATLHITHRFNFEGFELNVQLSTGTPAQCQYEVHRKWFNKYEPVFWCPDSIAPRIANSPTKDPSSSGSFKMPKITDILNKIPMPNIKSTLSDLSNSKFGTLGVARAATAGTVGKNSTSKVCSKMPSCSSIIFDSDYQPNYMYKIIIEAAGKSTSRTVELPRNKPKSNPIDKKNIVNVHITRRETTFKVESQHSTKITSGSKCKWELRDVSAKSKLIVKSCMTVGPECPSLPSCLSFTIEDVSKTRDYHLTVYTDLDDAYYGVAEIAEGQSSSSSTSSKKKIIIITVAVMVSLICMMLLVGGVKGRKKSN